WPKIAVGGGWLWKNESRTKVAAKSLVRKGSPAVKAAKGQLALRLGSLHIDCPRPAAGTPDNTLQPAHSSPGSSWCWLIGGQHAGDQPARRLRSRLHRCWPARAPVPAAAYIDRRAATFARGGSPQGRKEGSRAFWQNDYFPLGI
ncbi:hypothetical protein BHE74_00046349, partial [Ensete ventricosum]